MLNPFVTADVDKTAQVMPGTISKLKIKVSYKLDDKALFKELLIT